jgi:predicted MFS family arabinose efflux permease
VNGAIRQPGFRNLWGGLTISLLGAQVSGVALPLTAILAIGASAGELGWLGATRWLPYLFFGLIAGVVLDRVPRREILVVTHIGRALLLLSLPLAARQSALHMEQLVVVAFGVGALMVFSDAAYQSVLPTLVDPAQLADGNAKLEVSRSLAQVVGPGLGGALIQMIGAPLAVTLDSVAFAIDALLVSRIRLREMPCLEPRRIGTVGREVREGLAWVFGHPLLRPIQLASMCFIGANSVWATLYLLFLTHEVQLDVWQIGLLLAAGGPGALLGALLANQVLNRFGFGRPIVMTQIAAASSLFLTPLAGILPVVAAVRVLALGAAVAGLMITIGSVAELTLRQTVTPARLQGRMNATMRSLNWSTAAAGSLIGGSLGDHLGLVQALLLGATASVLSSGWLICSPVRSVSKLADFAGDAEATAA